MEPLHRTYQIGLALWLRNGGATGNTGELDQYGRRVQRDGSWTGAQLHIGSWTMAGLDQQFGLRCVSQRTTADLKEGEVSARV